MDPLVIILVPGLLGGLVIAAVVVLAGQRSRRTPSAVLPSRLVSVSPHMINMASIKVAGIGGLGLVAMAVAVAVGVPQIRSRMGIALALGIVIAVVMIVRARRGEGPMPSSGQHMGANAMLAIDETEAPQATDGRRRPGDADVSLASA